MQELEINTSSIVMMGATGAVGGEALRQLLKRHNLVRLTLLGRRKIDNLTSDIVEQHTIDISDVKTYQSTINNHNVAICTLGVGQPSKVSREEFSRIDKAAVLDFAQTCKASGVRHFQLLSSVGIDAQSKSFYLAAKGELVEELKALEFERLSIFQPSMILTPTNRYGVSQALTLWIWPVISPLMIGPLKKFRGVKVEVLGKAVANNSFVKGTGYEALFWQDFNDLSNTY